MRRNTQQLREAYEAVAKKAGITPKQLTAKCTALAAAKKKVIANLRPSDWLRLAEEVIAAPEVIPCDACGGSGTHRSGHSCYRCGGKGKQDAADQRRNAKYDSWKKTQTSAPLATKSESSADFRNDL